MRSWGTWLALVLVLATACGGGAEVDEAREASPDAASDPSQEAAVPSPEPSSDGGTDAGVPWIVDAHEAPLQLGDETTDDLFADEITARNTLARTPISVRGRVVSADGEPIAGAILTVDDVVVITDEAGDFAIRGLARRNRMFAVEASGHRKTLRPVQLFLPVSVPDVELAPVVLSDEREDTVRFLFGGDVAFGRRWLDIDGLTPRGVMPVDTDGALIRASDPGPGTLAAMQWLRPIFLQADFPTFNFETPVTDNPISPHPSKAFAFFTLPASLELMPWLNVTYVNMGNNHVFDYLQPGFDDTQLHLGMRDVDFSGAGDDVEEAFTPHRQEVKGYPYSFLGMSGVSGVDNPPLYVAATDDEETMANEAQGGAADLRDARRVRAAVKAERDAGRIPIVQVHTGVEYTFKPVPFARAGMDLAVDAGAALVIAHHPHVLQGFGRHNGVFVAHSLGNLCFDQDRLETMLSGLLQLDMRGEQIDQAQVFPMYLEDFRPRPIAGALARRLMRRIGEVSRDDGVLVVEHGDQAFLVDEEASVVRTSRTLDVEVEIGASGFSVVDLRGLLGGAESARVATSLETGLVGRFGEDLMEHGDFEDYDTDADLMEAERWDVEGSSRFVCVDEPYRGAAAVCSLREAGQDTDTVIAFRNRARVLGDAERVPNKDLSLVGYVRGDNAGPISMITRYYASAGPSEFGEEQTFVHPGGTFPWTQVAVDLNIPEDPHDSSAGDIYETGNPHAFRLFVRQSPPMEGKSLARFDEFAFVSWRPAAELSTGVSLSSPNPVDFLRVEGAAGRHVVQITLERVALRALR